MSATGGSASVFCLTPPHLSLPLETERRRRRERADPLQVVSRDPAKGPAGSDGAKSHRIASSGTNETPRLFRGLT